jgi:hypothetical protein
MSIGDSLDRVISKTKPSTFVMSVKGKLPAFIISDINNSASTAATRKVVKSIEDTGSRFIPYILPATTPSNLDDHLRDFNKTKMDWTYPLAGEKRIDIKSGLHLTGYSAKDINKVISCMVSHMRCWLVCASQRFPIVVLEHDALFVRKLDLYGNGNITYENINKHGIIGLNNPRGATRKSAKYYESVINIQNSIHSTKDFNGYTVSDSPWVDDDKYIPQGIAGNSAYVISPSMALRLLKKVDEVGLWPNDALMCKQFFPNQLKQIYPFVTELQGIQSTTTG